jgi:hypothetical protein
MSASSNSTEHRGLALIRQLELACTVCTNRLNYEDYSYTRGDVQTIQAHLRNAVHRLRFLEFALMGLTYKELREAKEYAQFVEDLRRRDERKYREWRS